MSAAAEPADPVAESPSEKAVRLKDLKRAAEPPRVWPPWDFFSWAVFVVSVLVVLGAMTVSAPEVLEKLLRGVLYVTFPVAALNTFIAGKCLGAREKALHRWFRENAGVPDEEGIVKDESDKERGTLWVTGKTPSSVRRAAFAADLF